MKFTHKNLSGHVTLAAILDFPKIGKKSLKIFFSRTTERVDLKFYLYSHVNDLFQVCEKHKDRLNALAAILDFMKIRLNCLKMFKNLLLKNQWTH